MGEVIKAEISDAPEETSMAQSQSQSQPEALPIPEKFLGEDGELDSKALLESYAKLEAKLGEQAEPHKESEESPENTDSLSGLGFSESELTQWTQEYAANGQLSEESYAALAAKHYPRMMVDTWLAGQQSIAQIAHANAVDIVGGQDKFDAMAEWASQNFSEAEKAAFNEAASRPGPSQEQALKGLAARYAASAPPGQRVSGSSARTSPEAFGSWAEVMAAMRDPRYKAGDLKYIQNVQDRISRM
jgi:hypothetical protein